jgi:hypothetical protein
MKNVPITSARELAVKSERLHGPAVKVAQVAKYSHLHRTKKSDRTVGPLKANPSAVSWSKTGVTLFLLDTDKSKSLVPHQQFTKRNNKLKRVLPQPHQTYVPMFNVAGAVILLISMRGIPTDRRVGYWCINFCRASGSKRLSSNQKSEKSLDQRRSNLCQSHSQGRGDAFGFDKYRKGN